MQQFEFFGKLIYCAMALILMLFAVSLVVLSAGGLGADVLMGKGGIFPLLHSVGLLIVSVAIFDVGKFIEGNFLGDKSNGFQLASSLIRSYAMIGSFMRGDA
jgi:hypothetical protein